MRSSRRTRSACRGRVAPRIEIGGVPLRSSRGSTTKSLALAAAIDGDCCRPPPHDAKAERAGACRSGPRVGLSPCFPDDVEAFCAETLLTTLRSAPSNLAIA